MDSGTFRGQYEDLEGIKSSTVALPVFCNDFVVYAYQLFKGIQPSICSLSTNAFSHRPRFSYSSPPLAKSSGADAVKLMGSVLSVQDMSYLVKISRAIGDLFCVAVVSSKRQLLDLLTPGAVPGLEAVSVTSRNMRLWKVPQRTLP